MFVRRVDPFATRASFADDDLDALLTTGADLLQRAADAHQHDPPTYVYGRHGRPCKRCGTAIKAKRDNVRSGLPRTVYWCPRCQAP
jgi:endonuclease-8